MMEEEKIPVVKIIMWPAAWHRGTPAPRETITGVDSADTWRQSGFAAFRWIAAYCRDDEDQITLDYEAHFQDGTVFVNRMYIRLNNLRDANPMFIKNESRHKAEWRSGINPDKLDDTSYRRLLTACRIETKEYLRILAELDI